MYKREIKNAQSIILKNGKPAIQGICPVCGTKVFRTVRLNSHSKFPTLIKWR
jgi:hypothetical protein